ncbi:hypothetical protein [Moraxella oblonga]|uniref:hypothetical protein n=1 Tax=Moraxella oblonga TaxID=200413 RepID=UPI00082F7118|nr:hypothetical protein [Moraxella oblonga]
MMWATHEPFLQSKAQLLVLPMSADGNIFHPVVARCKSQFYDNYDYYHKKATAGELNLGDVWIHTLTKQLTGLGVQTDRVEYIANIIAQKSPKHCISVRMFERCLINLKPQIYDLMRYKGLRRMAILGSALLVNDESPNPNSQITWLTPQDILQSCHTVLGDVPKLTIEVHFGKDTPLPILTGLQKMLEN